MIRFVARLNMVVDMSFTPDPGSARPPRAALSPIAAAALCCAMLTGGCESYVGARAITVHGKHGHKTCTQLLAEHKTTSARIDELSGLISKAEQEAAGTIIGAAVYGPTLAQARGERRILDEAIEEKRCR